jgi:hypothetical protein
VGERVGTMKALDLEVIASSILADELLISVKEGRLRITSIMSGNRQKSMSFSTRLLSDLSVDPTYAICQAWNNGYTIHPT